MVGCKTNAAEKIQMNLELTPDLTAFRDEVRTFLGAHRAEYESGGGTERPREAALAWQRRLIASGYAAHDALPHVRWQSSLPPLVGTVVEATIGIVPNRRFYTPC